MKGSYVLDFVLKATHAKDVDVFYMGDRPAKEDLCQWLQRRGLPPPPSIQREQFVGGGRTIQDPCFDVHHVDSLTTPDGGGEMTFNVDCWHIPMSGILQVFDPATGTSRSPAAGQSPGPLALLDPSRQVATESGLKGLLKMLLYPSLWDANLAGKLAADAYKDLGARPNGSLAETAVSALDQMLRGGSPKDLVDARTAVKCAEDELRGR